MRKYHCPLGVLLLCAWCNKPLGGEGRPSNGDVRVIASTVGAQTTFHVGELIRVQLSYSLAPGVPEKYSISSASYDRSGRLGTETFDVDPAFGWDDPLKLYFASFLAFIGGGLSSSQKLTAKPVLVIRDLNEWVRFNVPGHYRIRVQSSRVQPLNRSSNDPPMRVFSNEIDLTVIAATSEWQNVTLRRAVAALDAPVEADRILLSRPDSKEAVAAATLRYLGTPAAAAEMATRIDDPQYSSTFLLGLASTPARSAAAAKLEELLNDPNFPVTGNLLDALSLVSIPSGVVSGRPEQMQALERRFQAELLSVLGKKQGRARVISAYTIVDRAGLASVELPLNEKRALTEDLVAGFGQLPVSDRLMLLQSRWELLDHSGMAALLSKIVDSSTEDVNPHAPNAYEENQLSAEVLIRLAAIDPDAARPVILREILRPHPRFGAAVLGALPEKTLPENEQTLVEHLNGGDGNDDHIASLIFRYGTQASENAIAEYLDIRVGKLPCATQTPLLAYLLRVDSEAAAPFLRRAIAARGESFTACNRTLLTDVANLYNDPLLQEIAIGALNDDDPLIAANAAQYLTAHADTTAEGPLWERLAAWNSAWEPRAEELRYVPGETTEAPDQANLGTSLIMALGSAQGWLADDQSLDRLAALAVTAEQREQVQQIRLAWDRRPRAIQLLSSYPAQFAIAQYHPASLESAVAKLKQFPKGSTFVWTGTLTEQAERRTFEQIRKAVAPFGIVLEPSSGRTYQGIR